MRFGPEDQPSSHYDRITEAWKFLLGDDFHYGYFSRPDEPLPVATQRLTELMASRAELRPGSKVLDVGCGVGNPACFLAQSYDCRVTGISTSREGVEQARRQAASRGLADRVEFLVADGMSNGLPDASVDRAWALESSHLMPQKDRLLGECARVLEPGGRLVLCDIILPRKLSFSESVKHAKETTVLRYAFGRAKMETLEKYRRFAQDAGLAIVSAEDISEATLPTFHHWRQNLDENRERIRELIGDEGLELFESSCEILPRFWNERLLGYGLLVAEKP